MSNQDYIHPSAEQQKSFYEAYKDKGKIVMLNLLKFRKQADYTDIDHLKPDKDITGQEAYLTYMNSVTPIFDKVGGQMIYYGNSGDFLIGPSSEQWDAVLLVTYPSIEAFMGLALDKGYEAIAGHRTAALADSRLLPTLSPMG